MQEESGSDSEGNLELNKLNPSRPKQEEVAPKVEVKAPRVSINRIQVPRLIIDRIELENFKSYANKQVIGPFHHSFSSVVGPNGSGKSNLIECLLFIFGYTASWMRLSKLAQLIHHSSGHEAQRAVVAVHFREIVDNEDGSVSNVPRSEFSLKRAVNLQGISKYFINDK
jgi:structural maintenance of chromosome 4